VSNIKKWPGIMILEYFRIHRDGKIIYEETNKPNLLHVGGEQKILGILFTKNLVSVPDTYYLGVDARTSLSANDTLASLINEPNSGGYNRQAVSSTGGFTIETSGTIVKAKTGVITFSCTSGSWPQAKNLFLCDVGSGTSGTLYSSVVLSSPFTLNSGESITLKFSMALSNC